MIMKRLFAALLALAALTLSSCTAADITVARGESGAKNNFPEKGNIVALTVNISSGTFHIDGNCRYVENAKEENKKIIYYSDIHTALADGFKPCSACAPDYKNTEATHD